MEKVNDIDSHSKFFFLFSHSKNAPVCNGLALGFSVITFMKFIFYMHSSAMLEYNVVIIERLIVSWADTKCVECLRKPLVH